MGNAMRQRVLEVIPGEIKRVFEIADIEKTFDLMEKFFHTSKEWRAGYKERLKSSPRSFDEREIFAEYLKECLDPALKHITKRTDSVVFSIMRYVVRDKIDERRKYEREHFNYYKK
jgi:uncharacterized NAD(P)/FAD-binding protein YdhS